MGLSFGEEARGIMTAAAQPGAFRDSDAQAAGNRGPAGRKPWRLARVLAGLVGVVLLALVAAAGWIAWGLPQIELSRPVNGQPSIVLEAADGTPISQSGGGWAGPTLRQEI